VSPLRFAIAGTGTAARYHAQAIAATEGALLVAVSRADASRRADAEREFGVPCEASFDDLVRRDDVDGVCVCSPSGPHGPQATAAARAGKHVLVEKPMALTLAEADEAIDAARTAGVVLGVALQRRTEPAYQALQAAIADGALGRAVLATVTVPYLRTPEYFAATPWRATWAIDGGGVLINQAIHLADLLLWMCGDVREVRASAATVARAIEAEDTLTASLQFESGALGSIVATTGAAPGFPHRLEIYGDRGGVQIEADAVVRWEADPRRRPPDAAARADAGSGASPTGLSPDGHRRLLADFVDAVRTGREPLVSGREGRRSLALVLAVYEAARTGRPARPG
jgi:UDP-N-acetyl-2-amino-2-deoxyglucuronate dehydrogenase